VAPPVETPPATGVEPAAPPPPPSPDRPAEVLVTPPGTEFRVGGGPYTVPISITEASQLSAVTITLTYNPAVLRVRSVQEGSFMRQGSVAVTFTQQVDSADGRIDIALARTGDGAGASGSGLLAAVLFEAIAAGTGTLSLSGAGTTPAGTPVSMQFSAVNISVR
jgi:hypothetical protein